ncbi:MAG: hypothetical protein EBT50_06530 [Verrucomicrobia bacterium]|nr:hypothetical protein [Verrucomicrobiota bacterium]
MFGYLKSVARMRTRVLCPGPGPGTSAERVTLATGNLRTSSSEGRSNGLGKIGTVRITGETEKAVSL